MAGLFPDRPVHVMTRFWNVLTAEGLCLLLQMEKLRLQGESWFLKHPDDVRKGNGASVASFRPVFFHGVKGPPPCTVSTAGIAPTAGGKPGC